MSCALPQPSLLSDALLGHPHHSPPRRNPRACLRRVRLGNALSVEHRVLVLFPDWKANLASCPPTMGGAEAFPAEAWEVSPLATRWPSAHRGRTELLVCTEAFLKSHFRNKVLSRSPPAPGTFGMRIIDFLSCAVETGEPPCTLWGWHYQSPGGEALAQHPWSQPLSALGEVPGRGSEGALRS